MKKHEEKNSNYYNRTNSDFLHKAMTVPYASNVCVPMAVKHMDGIMFLKGETTTGLAPL